MNFRQKNTQPNQRNPFLPNKPKVALKLKSFLTELIFMKKSMKKQKSMLNWHPPPPNSHPVAHRTVADCQWYFSSEMADWIFIFTKISFAMEKKIAFVGFIYISIQKIHQKALAKVKLIFIWATTIWFYLFFLRFPEKLHFHAALEWKQVLKLCRLSQNRSVCLWPLLLPSLWFSTVWPTHFSHIQQSSQKLV